MCPVNQPRLKRRRLEAHIPPESHVWKPAAARFGEYPSAGDRKEFGGGLRREKGALPVNTSTGVGHQANTSTITWTLRSTNVLSQCESMRS
jgi:hypothetical protein